MNLQLIQAPSSLIWQLDFYVVLFAKAKAVLMSKYLVGQKVPSVFKQK